MILKLVSRNTKSSYIGKTFKKFMAGLEEAVNFIECSDANEYIARLNIEADEENERKAIEEARENKLESEIKIDIDF